MALKSNSFGLDTKLNRRRFLQRSALVAGGAALAPTIFQGLASPAAAKGRFGRHSGYGDLVEVADLRDGVKRLALPKGFQYRSFGAIGDPMSDGNLTPLALDGMAAFWHRGELRLVRNHEDRNAPGNGSIQPLSYDSKAGGGTTTLIVDPKTRELKRDFISITGTIVNCAGGLTPWGSWITSEETTAGPSNGWDKKHGYNFEVPAGANGPVEAVPIPAMGRFAHEAVACEPDGRIVYQTEDSGNNSGFYRFISNTPRNLHNGGKLQMLAVDGMPAYDTTSGQTVGRVLPTHWVDIDNPDPDPAAEAVATEGISKGGAMFGRLEGCWYAQGRTYFQSTSGGEAGLGQVWEYQSLGDDRGRLTLIFESSGIDELDSPDNMTVSPRGGIVICEDGDGDSYLRGLSSRGDIFDFALNLLSTTEWAGACFSNDGQTLFANWQGGTSGTIASRAGQGMTFAIWGPWENGAL
jgi:secreted PhoX family phosphatase